MENLICYYILVLSQYVCRHQLKDMFIPTADIVVELHITLIQSMQSFSQTNVWPWSAMLLDLQRRTGQKRSSLLAAQSRF